MNTDECVSYLLDEMPPEDRLAFERRLDRDEALRKELKSCSEDFANFAENSVVGLKPSDSTWFQVRSQISLEPRTGGAVFVFPWKLFWAAAACLLLGLNLFQFMYRGTEGKDTELQYTQTGERNTRGSTSEMAQLESDEAELEQLRGQVSEMDTVLEKALANNNSRQKRIRELQLERVQLESRIEYLERNYMELSELAAPLLGSLEEVSENRIRVVQLVKHGKDGLTNPGSEVWGSVVESLEGGNLAVLSSTTREGKSRSPELLKELSDLLRNDPLYAVNDLNEETSFMDGVSDPYAYAPEGINSKSPILESSDSWSGVPTNEISDEHVDYELEDGKSSDSLATVPSLADNSAYLSVAPLGPADFENEEIVSDDSETKSITDEETYAVAYVNEQEGVGVLSMGNIPEVDPDFRMVLWAMDDQGEWSEAIGELPTDLGSSADIGIKLPDDPRLRNNFLVSVESLLGDLPESPSDTIILETEESNP